MGLWELGQNLTFLMLKLCAFKKGNPGTVFCYIYIYIYIYLVNGLELLDMGFEVRNDMGKSCYNHSKVSFLIVCRTLSW